MHLVSLKFLLRFGGMFHLDVYLIYSHSICYAIVQGDSADSEKLRGLPQGIRQATSDLELRPLWSKSNSRSKVSIHGLCYMI